MYTRNIDFIFYCANSNEVGLALDFFRFYRGVTVLLEIISLSRGLAYQIREQQFLERISFVFNANYNLKKLLGHNSSNYSPDVHHYIENSIKKI